MFPWIEIYQGLRRMRLCLVCFSVTERQCDFCRLQLLQLRMKWSGKTLSGFSCSYIPWLSVMTCVWTCWNQNCCNRGDLTWLARSDSTLFSTRRRWKTGHQWRRCPSTDWSHSIPPYSLTSVTFIRLTGKPRGPAFFIKHSNSYRWADTPWEIYEYKSLTSVILQVRSVISGREINSVLFRTKQRKLNHTKQRNGNLSVDQNWILCLCFMKTHSSYSVWGSFYHWGY